MDFRIFEFIIYNLEYLDGKRRKDGQYSIWRFFVLPIKMMGL